MDEPFCRINDRLSEWGKLGFIASQSSDDMTLLGGNFLNRSQHPEKRVSLIESKAMCLKDYRKFNILFRKNT